MMNSDGSTGNCRRSFCDWRVAVEQGLRRLFTEFFEVEKNMTETSEVPAPIMILDRLGVKSPEQGLPINQIKKFEYSVPSGKVDRYGFYVADKRFLESDSITKNEKWLENRRTQKWIHMVGPNLEKYMAVKNLRKRKLKSRIRKGIPEALRGRVWGQMLGATKMLENNPGYYEQLLRENTSPCEEVISRDIGRTFPKHFLFDKNKSLGQQSLMNVLRAYSLHDPEVGYCQGMGFVSALFLSYMPEEATFWQLVALMTTQSFNLSGLYRPGMPKVSETMFIFEKLFHRFLPKLATHFDREGIYPTMYATQWLITIFAYSFKFDFVTRVWDAFMHEGWKVIFRVAIAILKISEKKFLSLKFEQIMDYFREIPQEIKVEQVLKEAFRLPLKRAVLEKLKTDFMHSK